MGEKAPETSFDRERKPELKPKAKPVTNEMVKNLGKTAIKGSKK